MVLLYRVGDKVFELEEFVNVGRVVSNGSGPNCFYLPRLGISPVEIGEFVGSVARGGSCNVDMLNLTPHNVTHLETSAHILHNGGVAVSSLDLNCFHGLCYLVDLSTGESKGLIEEDSVMTKLRNLELPIQILAIKTPASILPSSYDFSGMDFLALSPALASAVSQFEENGSEIQTLILDLPSVDMENDAELTAHRRFLQIPDGVSEYEDKLGRAVVELAYFGDLKEGYYYCSITPPRIESNAVPVSVALARLIMD